MSSKELYLLDEEATLNFGKQLSALFLPKIYSNQALVIFLQGELGAGKTTLVRGFLRGLNYNGTVKSPTFTLVEPYQFMSENKTTEFMVYHFDLYRTREAEELEYIGIRDYFHKNSCSFIEWPQYGKDYLPQADLIIYLEAVGDGRKLSLNAGSIVGKYIMYELNLN